MLRRLCQAAALSRWLLEAIAALALLYWSSDRLPAALALCAAHLRLLPAIVLHPVSAFLLGNLIIVTLFANSGRSADGPHSTRLQFTSVADDAHDRRHCDDSYFSADPPPQLHREAEEEADIVVYEDKAVCAETTTTRDSASFYSTVASPERCRQDGLFLPRTRSYDVAVAIAREGAERKLLRRWETDVGTRRNVAEKWGPEEEEQGPEEEYDEEFRRTIEAFIAKQLRFIKREEESLLLAAKAASAGGAVMVAVGGRG